MHISIDDAAGQLARDAGALTAICRFGLDVPEACVSQVRKAAMKDAREQVLDIALRMEKLSVALTQTRLCDVSIRITEEAVKRIESTDRERRRAISVGGAQ